MHVPYITPPLIKTHFWKKKYKWHIEKENRSEKQ